MTYRLEKRRAKPGMIDLPSLHYKYEVDTVTATREVFDDELELEEDLDQVLFPRTVEAFPPGIARMREREPVFRLWNLSGEAEPLRERHGQNMDWLCKKFGPVNTVSGKHCQEHWYSMTTALVDFNGLSGEVRCHQAFRISLTPRTAIRSTSR
ncbi:hypothetical protein BJY52DRAFT_1222221 [Lactarius psammicola]|nr:hypothetical protein BJY52DRAFT_1222221 [Lactarius psammicola]